MTTCPAPGVWLQLVDGQLTEERALGLRDHARECSVCRPRLGAGEALIRRVAVPIALPTPHADARARVLQRIGDRAPSPSFRTRFGLVWLAIPATALAAVFVVAPRMTSHPEGFTARGGSAPSLARDVGVRFYAAGASPQRLTDGARLGPETPIAAAYVNLTSGPAYLLAVVIDSAGKVQWLQPGPDAGEPITLRPHTQETPLRETVVLDEPAPGPLRLLTVVSAEPIPPVLIRSRGAASLNPQTLSRELPGAQISEVHLTLEAQTTP